MNKEELQNLVKGSRDTDLATLLTAKEDAKRRLLEDPTDNNLRAFERASRMLEEILSPAENKSLIFKNRAEAFRHLVGQGYKLGKSKFFKDAHDGLVKFEADGTIPEKSLDRYIKLTGIQKFTEIGKNVPAEKESVLYEKAEREVEKLKEQIRELRLKNEVLEGLYFKRSDFEMELAARATVLDSGLRQMVRAAAARLVSGVSGDATKAHVLCEIFDGILDKILREYADTSRFQVIMMDRALIPAESEALKS